MMDHIINFDWNYREPEQYFIKPEDLDNSVTERILRNKFRDPLISSDEEADDNKPIKKIDWDQLFSESQQYEKRQRVYVPGLIYPSLQHLKLSALTAQQHQQCLKVICSRYPHTSQIGFVPRPMKMDLQTFQDVKEIYEKEQQEFIEWAKNLWASDHCRRALRPKPWVESVYEACFKMKAAEIQSFPRTLRVAAHIPLETANNDVFEMVHQEDLILVNVDQLPEVECPMKITEKLSIMKPFQTPEPCPMHPCKFILPKDNSVTEKPLTAVHRSLAQMACDHGATCVASEGALRCLVEQGRAWMLPVSVVDMFGADGEPCNVIVLGSEFLLLKESAPLRTYRAYRHMLNTSLVPHNEKAKLRYSNVAALRAPKHGVALLATLFQDDLDDSSDEEDDFMIIDDGNESDSPTVKKSKGIPKKSSNNTMEQMDRKKKSQEGCTCKGTIFEYPPPRSFRKWRVRNKTINDKIDVIIHCGHKLKLQGNKNELILEPIPEYQLDVGASEQSEEKIRSLELSLMLRKNVTLANVRVDGISGDVVTFECYTAEQYREQRSNRRAHFANILHCTLQQLQGLLPGTYVLKHEANHGPNAILYASKSRSGEVLTLQPDCTKLMETDESRSVSVPPKLIPAMLPMHKHRRMLPLAFTFFPNMVAPEPRRPVTRQKTPPQALQWPKKKGKKRKARR